jgi:hypothetical protein
MDECRVKLEIFARIGTKPGRGLEVNSREDELKGLSTENK